MVFIELNVCNGLFQSLYKGIIGNMYARYGVQSNLYYYFPHSKTH